MKYTPFCVLPNLECVLFSFGYTEKNERTGKIEQLDQLTQPPWGKFNRSYFCPLSDQDMSTVKKSDLPPCLPPPLSPPYFALPLVCTSTCVTVGCHCQEPQWEYGPQLDPAITNGVLFVFSLWLRHAVVILHKRKDKNTKWGKTLKPSNAAPASWVSTVSPFKQYFQCWLSHENSKHSSHRAPNNVVICKGRGWEKYSLSVVGQ